MQFAAPTQKQSGEVRSPRKRRDAIGSTQTWQVLIKSKKESKLLNHVASFSNKTIKLLRLRSNGQLED